MSNSVVKSSGSRMSSAEFDVECYLCNSTVVEYFEEKYNGMRGMCINCKTNFPLE
ncbi:MAG: hypothetical protein IS860_02275 [Nitrosopumilus sp.]|nr:hypothetical protein [Nitrosopumilus sp.]MCE2505460.1 hypothetical protein [Nitrosopumilaceae archaeon]